MTKIIGLVQVKGGAGRSTVSNNLAGELSKLGNTVLIDCGMPEGASVLCFDVRQQNGR
jgi:chromosome partitioning protein